MVAEDESRRKRSLARLLATFRFARGLSAPYFTGTERWIAWRLVFALTLLTIVIVGTAVLFTYWQRGLFNALESKDWPAFLALLLSWHTTPEDGLTIGFVPLLLVFVLANVYRLYLQQRLQLRWRQWMTEQYLGKYFGSQIYYRLSLDKDATDNPDQRVAEDINLFTEKTLGLGVGLFENLISMLSFIVLLWALSRDVSFFGVYIPGSLVWIALLYAMIGTLITHIIGRKLVPLSFNQQRYEADFRFSLIRAREHAEGIAFYRGEQREQKRIRSVFQNVLENFSRIIDVTKRVTISITGLAQANLVFPLIIAAPAYFAGSIPLGGVFQTANALNKVVENLSWFVENYIKLADYSATIDRLVGFESDIERASRTRTGANYSKAAGSSYLSCRNLSVFKPDGGRLLENVDLQISKGDWTLISGASGSGKTSLLRTCAGLWPYTSGDVAIAKVETMFVPQRPYLPDGNLNFVLTYPHAQRVFSDGDIDQVFLTLGLEHLKVLGDHETSWMKTLSGGELQRLAIARIALQKPALVFLDEATSQLDPDMEIAAYRLLQQKVPDATLVSVAHHASVGQFHTRILSLKGRALKEVLVSPSDL